MSSEGSVDSQAEQKLLEEEWEAEMDKIAAVKGIGREQFKLQEIQALQRWQKDENPQDFEFLYDNHQKMIDRAGNRYMRSLQLPKAAVRSDMLRNYIGALKSYNPEKGTQISTHVTTHMQHTGRYLQKYQNIGKIMSTRVQHVGEFQRVNAMLAEQLGREPSTSEIADEMTLSPKEIETLRREIRKDVMAEGKGGDISTENSRLQDRLYFTHGSLNPEQQAVMEYTEGMFGRPALGNDVDAISKELRLSPQKVRALKKQIWRKVERYF